MGDKIVADKIAADKIVAVASTGPKRRPSSGGYARGEEQRARIIQAAIKVFGEEGYERASTREIAREAGIQPPALQYYFDSKEGLHRACADYLVEAAMQWLGEPLAAAQGVPDSATSAEALQALSDLVDALIDASLFSREVPERARFSARVHTDDGPATAIMKEKISVPIMNTVARLVGLVLQAPVGELVRLRAHLLLSQMSVLHVHHNTTLSKLGWPDFHGPRRAMVKAAMRAHIKGALSVEVEG